MAPPTEQDWDAKKTILRQLYFDSTLLKLMEVMEKEHNFVASKSQYETKFKNWAFRKNLSVNEWQYVIHKKRKREASGKKTEIKFCGSLICNKKIRKEESRHSISELNSSFISCPSPASPGDICVFTPLPVIQNAIVTPSMLQSLPFFSFLDTYNAQDSYVPQSSIAESFASNPRLPPRSPYLEILQQVPCITGVNNSTAEMPANTRLVQSASTFTPQLIFELFRHEKTTLSVPTTQEDQKQMLLHRMKPSMLERHDGDLEEQIGRLLGLSASDAFLEFLKFTVYLSSNQLLSFGQQKKVLEWITLPENATILKKVFAFNSPTIKAFLDSNLQIAVETGDIVAGKALLNADANRCLFSQRRERLLQAAVKLQHTELVKTLIKEGVNVNARIPTGTSTDHTETILAGATTVDLAKLILEAGALPNALSYNSSQKKFEAPIASARRRGDETLVRLLQKDENKDEARITEPAFVKPRPQTLIDAIQGGHLEDVQILLDNGKFCTNTLQLVGRTKRATELQLAAALGHDEIVKLLLKTTATKYMLLCQSLGWAVLHDAAKFGHVKVVAVLIEAGALVNTAAIDFNASTDDAESNYRTALWAAVKEGHIEVVNVLIDNGALVNMLLFSDYGITVLEVARTLGRSDIEALLVKNGALDIPFAPGSWYGEYNTGFRTAGSDAERARELVKIGVDPAYLLDWIPSDRHANKIERDTGKRNLQILLSICDRSNHLSLRGPLSGRSSLQYAVQIGDTETARALIAAGANVNQSVEGGLGHNSLLQLFLAITYFPTQSDVDFVGLMIRKGALVNAPPGLLHGTALQIAASRSCFEIVWLLIDAGADVNAPATGEASTALQEATHVVAAYAKYQATNADVVKYLLANGADVNAPPGEVSGRTALQVAVSEEVPNLESIDLLLDAGAEVNAPAGKVLGFTALQGAAILGHIKIAQDLLERGADPNAPGSSSGGELPWRVQLSGDA
ncbi:ankyrin repeat-containing domain protein [Halenospora varia]|nr:ankyrin repeat-containing domain protein [Halenospora varia]